MPGPTSFEVRVWSTLKYQGRRVTSYTVRWFVAGRRHRKTFRTAAAADAFRAELVTASRRGEAFDTHSGLPVTAMRARAASVTWYEFACTYTDARWPAISPKHRKGIAEALVTVTPVMLDEELDPEDAKAIRSALLNWAFTSRRGAAAQPADVTERLAWVARHSRPLIHLARPDVARQALEAIATRLDGTRAAPRTATLKRTNLNGALEYAVELGLLDHNPVRRLAWRKPRTTSRVDARSVVNPRQAQALLDAVALVRPSGPRLVAFFACMYYAALRPEEAANLRVSWLDLPEDDGGWGWVTLHAAAPEVDRQWDDGVARRRARELKHRARGESRRVPLQPALVELLRRHLDEYGVDSDGRVFVGQEGHPISGATYRRVWDTARRRALTEEQYASPLARRPYDLRHAAVSTWLNGGVAAPRVAQWAGHSVEVLLRTYAKCLDAYEEADLKRLERSLDT